MSYASLLIINDQQEIWRDIEPLLAGNEIHVVLADGAGEALECLAKEEFALVLLCAPSGSDTVETASAMREQMGVSMPPLIFVGEGGDSPGLIEQAYEAGAADFWTLPLSPPILKAKVQGFINLYRKELEHRHTINYLQSRVAEQLVEARQIKSLFLANMSHELRTPLNVILGYGEILKEELDEKLNQHAEDAERIIVAGRQLLTLIDDVLDLSKIESGKMKLMLESVSVTEVLDEVANSLRGLAKQRNNTLLVTTENPVPMAMLDRVKVRQILLNLINNACKFTENGTIRVVCRTQVQENREWVSLEVEDTGIGIAEEEVNSLFLAFSQGNPSAARKFGGVGLGLALSQMFANMMGGAITLTSKPGEGSTFTLLLPLDGNTDHPE